MQGRADKIISRTTNYINKFPTLHISFLFLQLCWPQLRFWMMKPQDKVCFKDVLDKKNHQPWWLSGEWEFQTEYLTQWYRFYWSWKMQHMIIWWHIWKYQYKSLSFHLVIAYIVGWRVYSRCLQRIRGPICTKRRFNKCKGFPHPKSPLWYKVRVVIWNHICDKFKW